MGYGYVTKTSSNTASTTDDYYGSTATKYYYVDPVSYQPNWTITYTPPQEADVTTEKCHLCGAELVSMDEFEWRVHTRDQKDKDTGEKTPVYIWKHTTVKKFECGTVKRDGDLDKSAKRVTLGDNCIDV